MTSLSSGSLLLLARATVTAAPQTLVVDWTDPFEFERWDAIMKGYTCPKDFCRANCVDGKPMFRFCVNVSDPRQAKILELHQTLPMHSLSMCALPCDDYAFLAGSPLVHLECRNMALVGDIIDFHTERFDAIYCVSAYPLDRFMDMPRVRALAFRDCTVLDAVITGSVELSCNRYGHWHVNVHHPACDWLHALVALFARCSSLSMTSSYLKDIVMHSVSGMTHVAFDTLNVALTGDWDALEEINVRTGQVEVPPGSRFSIVFGAAEEREGVFIVASFCSLRRTNKRARR